MRFKLVFILLGTVILSTTANAQQIPLYSQYYDNPFLYNPARIGDGGDMELYLLYRKQWVDFKGSPETRAATFSGLIKDKIGLGAYLYNDITDIVEKIGGQVTYAYHIGFNDARTHGLAIGLGLGIQETSIAYDRVNVHDDFDPLLTGNTERGAAIDANAGINYWFNGLNVGFSVPQLIETKIKRLDNSGKPGYQLARHFLFNASYQIDIKENVFSVEPLVMFRTASGGEFQLDGGVQLNLKDIIWLTALYRHDYAITVQGGVQLHERVRLSYATDLAINSIKDYAGATHEVGLALRFGKKEEESSIIETLKQLESKQSVQLQKLDSIQTQFQVIQEKAETLEKENTVIKEQLQQEKQRNEQLQQKINRMMEQFKDSLQKARTDYLNFEKQQNKKGRDGNGTSGTGGAQVPSAGKAAFEPLPASSPYHAAYTAIPKYILVVAAFRKGERAAVMADMLKQQGYDAHITSHPDIYWNFVYIEGTDDYNTSLQKLKELRTQKGFEDAWIHIKR